MKQDLAYGVILQFHFYYDFPQIHWVSSIWANRDSQLASRRVLKDFTEDFDRKFIPKWSSTNAESLLASVGKASLLIELICAAAWPCARWMSEDGLYVEVQKTLVLDHHSM